MILALWNVADVIRLSAAHALQRNQMQQQRLEPVPKTMHVTTFLNLDLALCGDTLSLRVGRTKNQDSWRRRTTLYED